MNRRRFLAVVGAGAGVGVTGGCLGGSPGGTTDRPDDDLGDTIDDVGCPSFVDGADRTNCYREREIDADVFVVPSALTFEEYADDDTVETVEFELRNTSDRPLRFNPNDWAVYRHCDGGWTRLAPDGADSLATTLESGGTVTWSLATQSHPSPRGGARAITAPLRSGSTHAFRVVGALGTDPEAPRVEAVAVFDYLQAVP